MELRLTGCEGVPRGSLLSVRVGGTRAQCGVEAGKALKLPALSGKEQMKVDVYSPVGQARLVVEPGPAKWSVPLTPQGASPDDVPMSLQLEVLGASGPQKPAPSGGEVGKPAEEATGYLEQHQLKQVMQALLQAVLKEKPADPCQFMVQMLQNTLAAAAGKACRPTRSQSAGATVRPRPSEKEAFAELGLEPSCGDLPAAAPRPRRSQASRARPFSAGRSRAPAFSTVPEHAPVLEGLPARPSSAGAAPLAPGGAGAEALGQPRPAARPASAPAAGRAAAAAGLPAVQPGQGGPPAPATPGQPSGMGLAVAPGPPAAAGSARSAVQLVSAARLGVPAGCALDTEAPRQSAAGAADPNAHAAASSAEVVVGAADSETVGRSARPGSQRPTSAGPSRQSTPGAADPRARAAASSATAVVGGADAETVGRSAGPGPQRPTSAGPSRQSTPSAADPSAHTAASSATAVAGDADGETVGMPPSPQEPSSPGMVWAATRSPYRSPFVPGEWQAGAKQGLLCA